MKIKILSSNNKSTWYNRYLNNQIIDVYYDIRLPKRCFTGKNGNHCLFNDDVVITELPESFCVKKSFHAEKWNKYINWLNKTYHDMFNGFCWNYYGVKSSKTSSLDEPFGTEIHIDDMIKHIDYMESQQYIKGGKQISKESQLTVNMKPEFDLTTDEGRLEYAKKYYPIGTKYISLGSEGQVYRNSEITRTPRYFGSCIEGGFAYIYANGEWAEIIKEETNMETQRLSREGLKEIYSVACDEWQGKLKSFGYRNPLENYIDLTNEEVNEMFFASNDKQKSILSKYLKQDDDSVDVSGCNISTNKIIDIRGSGEYENKSFWLSEIYNWEMKKDSIGKLCLIPTKKK